MCTAVMWTHLVLDPLHQLSTPRQPSITCFRHRVAPAGSRLVSPPLMGVMAARPGDLQGSTVVRLCAWIKGNSPRLPALSNGFPGQCVLPTPEGATGATSMACRQGGQTGQVRTWSTGVWVACPVSRTVVRTSGAAAADPVIIGDAQHLNGQGPGPDWGVWAVAQAETTTRLY